MIVLALYIYLCYYLQYDNNHQQTRYLNNMYYNITYRYESIGRRRVNEKLLKLFVQSIFNFICIFQCKWANFFFLNRSK